MKDSELRALVVLLDDEDHEVVAHVEQKIMAEGTGVIPFLEQEWESHFNPTLQRRLEDLIHQLQFELVKERLKSWKEESSDNLLKALWIICTYQYPDLEFETLLSEIEELHIEVWRALSDDLSPFDQVKVMNDIFFDKIGFRSNTKNFHSPANSMINSVLESKKGNPISLGSLYLLIAEKLKLPIYGVNLPNLFILTYKSDKIQFYINVFNKGLIFSKEDIDNYVDHLQLNPQEAYYQPCSNLEIVTRFLRNLIVSFEKIGDYDKSDEVKILLQKIDSNYWA